VPSSEERNVVLGRSAVAQKSHITESTRVPPRDA
jgi:hypothetical protein